MHNYGPCGDAGPSAREALVGQVRLASLAVAVVMLAPSLSALADDAPALSVVRLKPDAAASPDATPATAVSSEADKEVDALLARITDKTVDESEKKAEFDHLVSLDDAAVSRLGAVLRNGDAR